MRIGDPSPRASEAFPLAQRLLRLQGGDLVGRQTALEVALPVAVLVALAGPGVKAPDGIQLTVSHLHP